MVSARTTARRPEAASGTGNRGRRPQSASQSGGGPVALRLSGLGRGGAMRSVLIGMTLLAASAGAGRADPAPYDPKAAFASLDLPEPANGFRTASGAPG